MEKPTFKQFLDSKEQLWEAIKNVPVSIVEYDVRKYCSIPVGENEDEQTMIDVKPRYKILVEWRYDNMYDPTPISIQVCNPKDTDESEKYNTYFSGIKLKKWLMRNTTEGKNYGYKV